MRRAFYLFILSCFVILGVVGCSSEKDNDSKEEVTPTITEGEIVDSGLDFLCTSENVKLLGRTYLMEDVLWLSYSASGVEFKLTGTKCDINFLADDSYGTSAKRARVAVFVNGEQVLDTMIDEHEKTFTVFESTTEEEAVIRVIKLSEVSDSTVGIQSISIEGTKIEPTAENDLKIEFIGDSITCGYGVDGVLGDTYSTSNENASKTYAYKTAAMLNADYSMVSMSGYGIISGYTGDGKINDGQIIPPYYTTMGKSWGKFDGKVLTKNVEWDFSAFVPDIIVINLGTNDDSYCGSDEEKGLAYQAAYVEFLKTIRLHNPDAKIVCTLGIMGDNLYHYVEAAVAAYSEETGDTNITSMKFDVQSQATDGVVVDWHPSESTHTKAAEKLAAFLQEN